MSGAHNILSTPPMYICKFVNVTGNISKEKIARNAKKYQKRIRNVTRALDNATLSDNSNCIHPISFNTIDNCTDNQVHCLVIFRITHF